MPLIVGCPNMGVWARTAIGVNSSKPPSSSLNRSFIGSPREGRVLIVDDAAPVIAAPGSQERRGADHCQLSLGVDCDRGSLPFLAEQAPPKIGAVPNASDVRFLALRPDLASAEPVNSVTRARRCGWDS